MAEPAAMHGRVAVEYLGFARDSCWRWSDDNEAVEWTSGGTVAFRDEIEQVIARLAHQGLPAFEAILFLLARCRKNAPPLQQTLEQVLPAIVRSARPNIAAAQELASRLKSLDDGLELLDSTLRDHSATLEEKLHLIELLFESLPAPCLFYPPSGAAIVLEALTERLMDHPLRLMHAPLQLKRWTLALRALQQILARFDPEALELRKRTGLDQLVQPAPVECPPFRKVRQLLEQLEDDPDYRGVACLARDLMAAVHIPRPVSSRQDLPVGGVSDITNRGPLDRLLLSELANDDLTLAVRVALNEALYLRRETPPERPRGGRALLLDAGIRMWGVPRVFAAAAALALAATATTSEELLALQARRSDLVPVDFTTREGLIRHLEALEPDPHPGEALPAFLEVARSAARGCDAIVVTHRDCLSDPAFRRSIPDDADALYCAAVTSEGSFQLLSFTRGGWNVIRAADVRLQDVLQPRLREVPGRPLAQPELSRQLPLIFTVDPFPLLLPAEYRPEHACEHSIHGVVAMTRDRRLLQWKDIHRGAMQLAMGLPVGCVDWVSLGDDGMARLVIRHHGHAKLVTVDIETRRSGVLDLHGAPGGPFHCVESGGALLIRSGSTLFAFDLVTGRLLQVTSAPGESIQPGRFFLHNRRLYSVAWDGTGIQTAEVRLPQLPPHDRLVAVLDREGLDGPFVLTRQGNIVCTVDGQTVPLSEPIGPVLQLLAVSRDGHRLVIVQPGQLPQATRAVLLDLAVGAVRPCWPQREQFFLQGPLVRFSNQRSMHRRWLAVAVDADGGLILLARKSTCWRIQPAEGQVPMCLSPCPRDQQATFVGFRWADQGLRVQAGVALQVAHLSGGNCVYLDPRGLLHLKSADAGIPETTLVVGHHSPLTAWCSDGSVCGDSFFLPDPTRCDPHAVWANVVRFGRAAR